MAALCLMLRQSITKTPAIINNLCSGISGCPRTVPTRVPVGTKRFTRKRFNATCPFRAHVPLCRVFASTASNAHMNSSEETKKDSPYGVWESPISSAMASGSSMRFGGVSVDGEDRLLWVEGRPTEKGCDGCLEFGVQISHIVADRFREC